MTNGEYDLSPDLMFSLPVQADKGEINVLNDININPSLIKLIKKSEEELLKERDIVKEYLP